ASRIDLRIGNMMYDACFQADESFDLIWCTGVLYHNPEQLRMIRMLFDRLKPNGFLVIESSTARRSRHNADDNVVEIWYPPESNPQSGMYRVAENVTHLPSRKAIWSWLSMVGFDDIRLSECFRRSYPHLAKVRAAFVCRKPVTPVAQTYYNHAGLNYPVGRAL
ncbi:MAG: class I SAM-dependent methyltransferase, partial [Actinomycetota bacterium]